MHRGDHDSTTLIEAIISTADRRAMSVPIRTDQVRDRRVDAAIDSYVDWREQSGTTTAAYEGWTGAPSSQRPLAFAAYQAALDREQHRELPCLEQCVIGHVFWR